MTETRSFLALVEVANQFLDDYDLPEPRTVNISMTSGMIDFIFDGCGACANLISESLYWETYENGVTSARVRYDGCAITALVYES